MANILFYLTFAMMSLLFVVFIFMLVGWRWIMKLIVKKAGKIILTDSYQENIIELMPGLRHMGIQ
ncbi:FMN-binding glutamate synthase family protein, partial [Neobacillus drentensis]